MTTAETFERFAAHEAHGSSPLYETLSAGVVNDELVLGIASEIPADQPEPNLLFAAVQYLLFDSPEESLASYYPGIAASPTPPDEEVVRLFREFCQAHRDELLALFSARRVQTNVIRRSGILYPVFEYLSQHCNRTPLGIVEIGASAGLNLLFDKFGYDYGSHGRYGIAESPVQITTEIRGAYVPPLAARPPAVGTRLGIDLNPLDVQNPVAVRWLRALIWPEHDDRRSLLDEAVSIAQQRPPTLIAGDAIAAISAVCEQVPRDEQLCVFNTHTLYQMTADQRAALRERIASIGRKRDLFWVDCEWYGAAPEVRLHEYVDGEKRTAVLADYDAHGRWIEWQPEHTPEQESTR